MILKNREHRISTHKLMAFVLFIFLLTGFSVQTNAGPFYQFRHKQPARTLSFTNTHTGETIKDIIYWEKGRYVKPALAEISKNLRDHRQNEIKDVDPALLDTLWDLQQELKKNNRDANIVYQVISGYRAPKTNAMLRASGGGQAKQSRHMHGDAIDVRVSGVSLLELRNTAWCLQRGGIGYYSGSNFIHIDTHKVRFWRWSPKRNQCKKDNS